MHLPNVISQFREGSVIFLHFSYCSRCSLSLLNRAPILPITWPWNDLPSLASLACLGCFGLSGSMSVAYERMRGNRVLEARNVRRAVRCARSCMEAIMEGNMRGKGYQWKEAQQEEAMKGRESSEEHPEEGRRAVY